MFWNESVGAGTIVPTRTATFGTGTVLLRTGLVHDDRTTGDHRLVETRNRILSELGRRHLDEPETTWPTRLAIKCDTRGNDLAHALENLAEFILGEGVREVSNVELGRHKGPFQRFQGHGRAHFE